MTLFRKYIAIYLSIFLLGYYLFVSWLLHRSGFEHSEATFIAEKIKLLFEADDNTLLTLGTTFPSLLFLSSAVFTPFGFPYAPVLASITFICLLFFALLIDFRKSSLPRRVYIPVLVLLFVFHPGLIYAAVSGRGIGAILLFFYLVFRSLFKYYATQTTFYLSMASIYLTCLIFCDYNYIWLLLAFLPFIVFVSLEGLKLNKEEPPIIQYYQSVNNVSQRRKLANRTLAIYVIVFLLPVGALYLFRTLNFYHAGDATYFLTSQYANWHVTGNESIGAMISSGLVDNVVEQSQIVYQFYVLALTPLLLLVFIMFKGKIYELFTLIAPFILISVLLIDIQYYLTAEYYLIFLVLGLLGICLYAGKKYTSKLMWPVILGVTFLNIFTGIFYFRNSADREEHAFFSYVKKAKNWRDVRGASEEYRLAAYISDLADPTHKILMDDAAAYKIMVHMRNLKPVVMPVDNNFITVVENPKSGAKYICVAKSNNRLKSYTVLNEYNINLMMSRHRFDAILMFETPHWAIYRIM